MVSTFVKDMKLELERPSGRRLQASVVDWGLSRSCSSGLHRRGAVRPWMIQSRVHDLLRSASDKQVLVITDRAVRGEAHQRLISAVCGSIWLR